MSGISSLADIEAIESIPLAEYNLPDNTYEALQRGAAINPGAPALTFFLQGTAYEESITFTHAQLMQHINQAANLFHSLGVGPDDVISIILPNLPQTIFAIWGGEAAGIINPINPLLEPAVMADIMNAAGTKVLVTLAPFPQTDIWQKVASILDEAPTVETVLRVDMIHYLTGFKQFAARLIRWRNRGPRPGGKQRILDFDKMLGRQPGDGLRHGRTIRPDDIAAYFHTGGTTGTPKLARQTHFNQAFDAWSASRNLNVRPTTTMFCGLPLFHVNGVIVTGLIPWTLGAHVIFGTPAGYRGEGVIANFWKIVAHYRINFFSGVPTVYSALLNVPIDDAEIKSLEFAICGAAPMPVEVFQEFEKRTGLRILEGYGLTEGACVNAVNPALGERRVGSIGYRLPHQEMKVAQLTADGKYQRDCEPNEIGIVIVRGPNVFAGYKDERANQTVWVDTGDGKGPWLNTGDMGRQDEDGYFWLTGRRKELIIRGGHNIDPQLIESPLHQHPAVALAAAVGRPDARVGELPVAYVELEPGQSATEAELLQFAADNIGERAAVPKKIAIVSELPQTAVGKIFKPRLVWQEVEEVYADAVRSLDGVTAVSVKVGPHKMHGMSAAVTVTPAPGADTAVLQEQIQHALGQYTIHYDLHIDGEA